MKKVTGVRFRIPGKIYFFDRNNLDLKKGMYVIVDTAKGNEYGEVVFVDREVSDEEVGEDLKKIISISTPKDEKIRSNYKAKERGAFETCKKKIEKHNLPMKLINAEYKYDGSKIIFYFTAEGRIDFRELVKDLAAVFKTRIELRQIGVRDEVKRMGGLGPCGRELCCCTFLDNFETVSIKMAKEQNISLNPTKISGTCGRLMCCLKYEQSTYEDISSKLPKIGAIVETEEGKGEVVSVEVLREVVRVRYLDGDEAYFKKHNASDIKVIKDAKVDNRIIADNEEDLKELENLEKLESTEPPVDDGEI